MANIVSNMVWARNFISRFSDFECIARSSRGGSNKTTRRSDIEPADELPYTHEITCRERNSTMNL